MRAASAVAHRPLSTPALSSLATASGTPLNSNPLGPGAALVVHAAPGASVKIKDATFSAKHSFEIQEFTDAEIASPDVPEYLRIRGYRITNQGAKTFTITQPGKWIITPLGEVHSA